MNGEKNDILAQVWALIEELLDFFKEFFDGFLKKDDEEGK